MSSINNIHKRFALILMDPQNGFINDGYWSRMFPIGQSTPILESFQRIVLFLRSIPNPHLIPILISETGFSRRDRQIFEPIANEISQHGFSSITRTYKPHTNLSICPGVHQWLQEQLESKLDVVIGGCTITSCIRDSSIQIKKMFPQLNLFVDRNLCAARKDNYVERCEKCLEKYMIYGSPPIQDCTTCLSEDLTKQMLSPVQLAFQQMKDAGVYVIDNYSLTTNS
ncbi:unnamed protein product [Rotaria sp. Silwood1]|nr:unnamed protein product [Rotaria sp. Silwood1]CAF1274220.1 unnamed protein product [Rotaria sp. Silwood1]CAF3492954.1 unnamed protein product [Rotaria sp. Silwood1]CAF3597693.1 unnamed protein product [Rotaria sp. Silwood1]CAF3613905.1 unnamed protein product [Rotaria sp. Silwood1]